MTLFDQTPDKPESFGYKILWFALKASDPASVVDALELGEATTANWASGLAAAYSKEVSQGSDRWLFVSPPINDWVFAVGRELPYPAAVGAHQNIGAKFDAMFSRLMRRFDDVQFFGSYRVSDFVAWARAVNGKPTRIFAYADGQVLMNFGDQTLEEAKLGFANLTGLSAADAEDEIFRMAEEQDAEEETLVASGLSRSEAQAKVRQNGRNAFPDEEDVVELAGLWSLDPRELSEQDHPPGLGMAAFLPKNLAQ
jgi:hypothetical protein